jgi:hypothetical protein
MEFNASWKMIRFKRDIVIKLFSHLKFGFAAATLALFGAHAQAPGVVRVALVIGNGAYISAPVLLNPSNDAKAMGQTLRGLDIMY